MHQRSIRLSIVLVILTLFVGFGVSFVAPKPVKAAALEDFIAQLTLGDFIRNLFQGLFGSGGGGVDPAYVPTATPTRPIGPITATPTLNPQCEFTNLGDCTPNCIGGSCTSNGCTSGRYQCVMPTATPTPVLMQCPYTGPFGWVACQLACGLGNCTRNNCASGYRCNISSPEPSPTPRPSNTPVPISPTHTPAPGAPSNTPPPTNPPAPNPPVPTNPPVPPNATATPGSTEPFGDPCYYNVRLFNREAGELEVLPSALQTGTISVDPVGCITRGVKELVPSFFVERSEEINREEWPCTRVDYVGAECTQDNVSGRFVCIGGPDHEIKGCYDENTGAYQRVSLLSRESIPHHSSFEAWFSDFTLYVIRPELTSPFSLSMLENWRSSVPMPTPTRP